MSTSPACTAPFCFHNPLRLAPPAHAKANSKPITTRRCTISSACETGLCPPTASAALGAPTPMGVSAIPSDFSLAPQLAGSGHHQLQVAPSVGGTQLRRDAVGLCGRLRERA